MTSQLDMIMQLYMMNLLQQQQQQQQLQQQQQQQSQPLQQHQFIPNLSPSKLRGENLINPTALLTNATFTPIQSAKSQQQQLQQQQQQHQDKRTQKRQNSQNTNCSSSRSSSRSPNSNSSFIQNNNLVQSQAQNLLQQSMLLPPPTSSATTAPATTNNLSALTQLMFLQQQSQTPLLTTPIHNPNSFLLTPTTPNSQASSLTDFMLASSGNNIGQHCSNFPFVLPSSISTISTTTTTPTVTTSNVANISFTAQNFLQSSTVTSTPTDEKVHDEEEEQQHNVDGGGDSSSLVRRISTISRDGGDDDGDGNDEEFERRNTLDDDDGCNDDENDVDEGECESKNYAQHVDDDKNHTDEDDLPLSCLQTSSSGVVSSCTTSAESSAKLHLSSDLQGLESSTTMDDTSTMDSMQQMPYTPIKQEADSSQQQQAISYCCKDTLSTVIMQQAANSSSTINEDSNMTPLAFAASAILTPPSSEQLISHTAYDPSQKTPTVAALGSSNSTTASTGGAATVSLNLTTASSLEAFLQNEENLKNLKKYSSYLECENVLCRQENLREHFHCFDAPCEGKILSKKDDIIRHLKWHKKRKESLQLGFARFSSSDDCAPAYGEGCAYNWKQTHYHCVYEDCPKVYVSTSDVQMHANFHRKNSEIVQEGFRRFRAHENCKIEECPFYGKKMSHYHCCREGCNHTFKNKADMDKHKSYHLKDYQLTQDGFKKILKTEVCPFEDCKFSTTCNHIHCVRADCNYILHSSSQMISHKRKHDRADGEQAYQSYKKQHKESSGEDESPTSTQQKQQQQQQQQQQQPALLASCTGSNVTTPLSSHTSAEQFLSRKRGRPPKMIQLPADSSNSEMKRFKLEAETQQQQQQQQLLNLAASSMPAAAASGIFPPFLPNFNSAAAAAAMQSQDPNAPPNFQLTHLMALFQLQNPLFYQNLYPGGAMASMLAAGTLPQNAAMLGNLAAFNAAAAAAAVNAPMPQIKSEFGDNKQFKE